MPPGSFYLLQLSKAGEICALRKEFTSLLFSVNALEQFDVPSVDGREVFVVSVILNFVIRVERIAFIVCPAVRQVTSSGDILQVQNDRFLCRKVDFFKGGLQLS